MRKSIILFIALFVANISFAQIVKTVGVVYTASAPVHTPSGQGAWIAIDTTSGSWYEWERTTGVWRDAGYRIQLTNTTGVPSYTPSKARGRVALNSGDSLYAYQAGTWDCLNCVTASDTATYLLQDSILVYYANGIEFDRDTIPFVTLTKILQIVSDSLSALPDSIMSGYGVAGYLPQYFSATKFDTTGVYWDASTGQLGIGTNAPDQMVVVRRPGIAYNQFALSTSGRIQLYNNIGGGINYLNFDSGAGSSQINYASVNSLLFRSGSNTRATLTKDGKFGIGATPTARLHITGEGTTSSTTALLVEKSDGVDIIKADNGGFVTIGAGANTLGVVLDVQSTTAVFAPPRMTTAQRDALTPPTGGIVFCTDCTATDGSTGVSQTYSSGTWKNHY